MHNILFLKILDALQNLPYDRADLKRFEMVALLSVLDLLVEGYAIE
jgi:hypothetical protein